VNERRSLACRLAVGALLAGWLVACGSRVDQAHFDRIENGMEQSRVLAILGEPTSSSSVAIGSFSGTSSVWKSKDATITITFVNGKVAFKTFAKDGNQPKQPAEER
jgi:outer membrane protein assembly factor BamE (lipoprotein component of BamABCDE complex)